MEAMHRITRLPTLALLTTSALLLGACSSAESTADNGEEAGINVITSTAIWGDVAEAVLNPGAVAVQAIVEGNGLDPHSFEPSAADMVRAREADVVVVGGGGYDAWLYRSVDEEKIIHGLPLADHDHSHGSEDEEHSHEHGDDHGGHDHESAGFRGMDSNEHIWYDTATVSRMAEEIAAKVAELDPAAAGDAADFQAELSQLQTRIEALPDLRVAQTEPTADYLLLHSGANEVTPADYRATSLGHSEPSAADLAAFLGLIEEGGLDLLIYNPQTATDLTSRIRRAAEEADIPVVEIFETPEAGEDYLDFFHAALDRLEAAATEAEG
ncbi:Manganese ABC transporter substrate-binding lipoprotein precursor [Corynebacterium occultum]|uniref:Manganese ABC transporter substrate-binding lipoprotein n=2 Tax=Corynebacterium occultum TaxID=2675219 RepID=A0A6B8W6N1_9CORY|nr:Manganese ABC transporter substrate-binding lipoprotein precursor [Corynebacterium occultum]